jgi:O-antigen/teichoic acid export membrane protein
MTALRWAVAWSYLGEALLRISQPLAYLALSFLLVPEEFGVALPCLMIVALVQVVMEFAFGKVVIQDSKGSELQSTAHMASVVFGALAALATGGLGYVFGGHMFQDQRVSLVLLATAVPVTLLGLSAVPQSVLQRELRFKALFYVRLVTTLSFAVFGLAMAYAGYGFWSIVGAQTVSLLIQAFGLLAILRGSVWGALERDGLSRILEFAKWAWLTGLAYWSYIWVDSLVVGINLSPHDLGIYRLGNQVAISVFGLLLTPLLPVFYAHISDPHKTSEEKRDILVKTVRLTMPVAICSAFFMYAVCIPLARYLIPDAWDGLGRVASLLALNHGLFWWTALIAVALRALQSPAKETLFSVVGLAASVPIMFVASRYGIDELLWSRLLINLVVITPLAFMMTYRFAPRISARSALMTCLLLALNLALVAVAWRLEAWGLPTPILTLVLAILFGSLMLSWLLYQKRAGLITL